MTSLTKLKDYQDGNKSMKPSGGPRVPLEALGPQSRPVLLQPGLSPPYPPPRQVKGCLSGADHEVPRPGASALLQRWQGGSL